MYFFAILLLKECKSARVFTRALTSSKVIFTRSLFSMDKEYAKYLLEKTKKDYNLIAEEFARTRVRPWPEIKFLVDDYIVAGERVLDLGCGNGRLLEFLKDKRIDYIGVDPSEKLIGEAQKRYPPQPWPPEHKDKKEMFLPTVKFQVASGLELPFPNNYFDKVYSIATLHRIPSREFRLQFLKEIKRVLKSERFLILTVWKLKSKKVLTLSLKYTLLKLISKSKLDFKDILEPWGKEKIKIYYHHFSKRELVNLVKKADFEVLKSGLIRNERGNRNNIYLIAKKSR